MEHQIVLQCTYCGEEKTTEHFYPLPDRKSGWSSRCRPCKREYARDAAAKYRKRYPERARESSDRARMKCLFGITPEDYDRLHESQNGLCAVCHRPESAVLHGKVKRLAIDHDHETGAIRGLLCTRCNTALGLLQDDLDNIAALWAYLAKSGTHMEVAS